MTAAACVCQGDDAPAAKEAIQKSGRLAELADDSHFMAAIHRCARCGQHFLTLFCECVDWADGDDPQTWMAVPVNDGEVQRLRVANVAAHENAIVDIIADPRRFLYHDMPKGKPARLEWLNRQLYIPPHD